MLLKINYSTYIPDDELVFYAHGRFDAKGVLDAIEQLKPGTDFMDYWSEDEINEMLRNEIENGYLEPLDLIENSVQDVICDEEIIDAIFDNPIDLVERIPGLVAGTAGYSPWSEYITLDGMGQYARDMWDGYNFYDLDIYEGTECIESLWGGYLPNEEDWGDIVKSFDITGIIKSDDDYILEHLPRYEIRPSAWEVVEL